MSTAAVHSIQTNSASRNLAASGTRSSLHIPHMSGIRISTKSPVRELISVPLHSALEGQVVLVPGGVSAKGKLLVSERLVGLGASMDNSSLSAEKTIKNPARDSYGAWDYGLRARMEREEERSERAANRVSAGGSMSARLSTSGGWRVERVNSLEQNSPLTLAAAGGKGTLLSKLVPTDSVLTRDIHMASATA